jgi:hypothetical protein
MYQKKSRKTQEVLVQLLFFKKINIKKGRKEEGKEKERILSSGI